jgi:O-antigen/teichoic acid export membrane protein
VQISNKLKKIKADKRLFALYRNSIVALIARLCNLIVNILLVPILIKYLGQSLYGVYAVIISVPSVINFSDLGLSLGLLNKVPEYKKNRDPDKLKKAISSTTMIATIISLFLILVYLSVYKVVDWPHLVGINQKEIDNIVTKAIFCFVLIFLAGIPFNVVNNYVTGDQRGYIVEIGKIISAVLNLTLVFLCISFNLDIIWIVSAFVFSNTAIYIATYFLVFGFQERKLRPGLRFVSISEVRSLFGTSSKYFLLQLFTVFYIGADSFLIAQFKGSEMVTLYSVMYRVGAIVSLPATLYAGQLLPALNEAFILNDRKWLHKNIKMLILGSTFYLILIAGGLYLAGDWALKLWLGDAIIFSATDWVAVFALILMLVYNVVFSFILLMPAFLKINLIIFPIATLITFVFKLIFLANYDMPFVITWASILYVIIFCGTSLLIIRQKLFNVPIQKLE